MEPRDEILSQAASLEAQGRLKTQSVSRYGRPEGWSYYLDVPSVPYFVSPYRYHSQRAAREAAIEDLRQLMENEGVVADTILAREASKPRLRAESGFGVDEFIDERTRRPWLKVRAQAGDHCDACGQEPEFVFFLSPAENRCRSCIHLCQP